MEIISTFSNKSAPNAENYFSLNLFGLWLNSFFLDLGQNQSKLEISLLIILEIISNQNQVKN